VDSDIIMVSPESKREKGIRIGIQYCGIALMAICVFLNFVEMWKSLQTIPVLPIPEILMPKSATKSKVATVYKPFFGLYFLEYWMLVCPLLSGFLSYIIGKEKCTGLLARSTPWISFLSMIPMAIFMKLVLTSLDSEENRTFWSIDAYLFFCGLICEILMFSITVLCCLITRVCPCQDVRKVEENQARTGINVLNIL